MTHAEAMSAVPQDTHDALTAAGISPTGLISWIITHGCDAAKVLRTLLPLLPISDAAKKAITDVLDILCP